MTAPQIIGFEPDPDFSEWDDEDGTATGMYEYDDGTRQRGRMPAEFAASLVKKPKAPAPAAVVPEPAKPGSYEAFEAAQIERERAGTPLSIAIPKASRIAFVHNQPGNLKFAGQEGAVQGEPAEDGGHWAAFESPEQGYQALHAQIRKDAGRGLTLGQFVTKYAPPSSNDTATYIAQATRALGGSPDTPISQINPERLARFMAQKESSTAVGGVSPEAPEPVAGSAAQPRYPALDGSQPAQVGGLPPEQVDVHGRLLTTGELDQRQQQERERAELAAQAVQLAAQERIRGREEAMTAVAQNHQDQQMNAQRQLAEQQAIKAEAATNIQQTMGTQLDHGRLFRGMSGGGVLLGLLGVALSAAGQTLQQRAGNGNAPNLGLSMMFKAVDDDVEQQKQDKQSRLAYWTRVYGNAEQGIQATKAEIFNASAAYIAQKAQTGIQNADIQAAALAQAQELKSQGDAAAAKLVQLEEQKVQIKYAAPRPVPMPRGAMPPAVASGEIGKVGIEDKDPEVRAELANMFNAKNPTHKGQMATLGQEMAQISKLEQTLSGLENLYGVQPETGGGYPADPRLYNSTASGPAWNVVDALTPDTERDRQLKAYWAQVEGDTRMGWKTEPNGETTQLRLSGIDLPKRDADVPLVLQKLRREIERRRQDIMSQTNMPVRAAWKLQNDYPLSTARGGRPVSGRLPEM